MRISIDKVRNAIQMHSDLVDIRTAACGRKRVFSSEDLFRSFHERMLNSTPEAQMVNAAKKELVEYMMSFTYDEVLDLEALMDYGRSLLNAGAFNGINDEFINNLRSSEPNSELLSPQKYISGSKWYFENIYKAPDGKHSAVHYMIEKDTFSRYLSYALDAFEQLS